MFHVFNKFSTESELRVIMQCNKKETSPTMDVKKPMIMTHQLSSTNYHKRKALPEKRRMEFNINGNLTIGKFRDMNHAKLQTQSSKDGSQ